MAKRKKKAKPRRRRAVVKPPPRYTDYPDDDLACNERIFVPLYHGLNTKEEIIQSVQDKLIKPLFYSLTEELAVPFAKWWRGYKRNILANEDETAETVIIKIRSRALFDCVVKWFHPIRNRKLASANAHKILHGLGKARRSTPPSSEPPPC
jgi:hypothetical protein